MLLNLALDCIMSKSYVFAFKKFSGKNSGMCSTAQGIIFK